MTQGRTAIPSPHRNGPCTIEVRIGVLESKGNPSASNFQRYARVQALVERVLVPLSEQYPIIQVRMK